MRPLALATAALALACCTGSEPARPPGAMRADAVAYGASRSHHTATLLADGRLLVAGGRGGGSTALATVEVVDLARGGLSTGAPLSTGRTDHTATVLADGRVLVAGGTDRSGTPLATAELYDPVTGLWSPGPSLAEARARHTATRLPSGAVLVAGGAGAAGPLAGAELLAPDVSGWSAAAPLAGPRAGHAAALLADGTVLASGGAGGAGPLATAERYDPAVDAWSPAGSFSQARMGHVAVRLAGGGVLAAGGEGPSGSLASAELYDPAADAWTPTGALAAPRSEAQAVLLPSGGVLVAGGLDGAAEVASVEVWYPGTGVFATAAPLAEARAGHTATLLPSGRVFVAGGERAGGALASSELVDLAAPAWSATAATSSSRRGHTATLLPDGRVLVAGGLDGFGGYLADSQLFDPATGAWSATGSMLAARTDHTATLLETGKVLVVGGAVGSGTPLGAAEVYDPAGGTWAATGALAVPRTGHTATLLPGGAVLVAGGERLEWGFPTVTPTVEIYDPYAGAFVPGASMAVPRARHTASLLPTGDVLVAGGEDAAGGRLASCERWVSNGWGWASAPGLAHARARHTATVLDDGRVLVAGGDGATGPLASSEIHRPASGWSAGPALGEPRAEHAAVLLPSGDVLVAGGRAGAEIASAERFDPWLGAWAPMPSLGRARTGLTLTLAPDGRALAAGGDAGDLQHVAEVLDGGLAQDPALVPALDGGLPARTPNTPLALTGAGLAGGPEASGGGVRASASNHPVLRMEGASGPVTHLRLDDLGGPAVTATVPLGTVPGWYWLRPQVAGASGVARPVLVLGRIVITPASAAVPPRGGVTFSASGGDGFTWSLDVNASGATLDSATGAYLAGGVGGVTDVLRVVDALGNAATAAVAVGPRLSVDANPGGADPGGTILFTASGGSRQGYVWSIVPGGSGSTLDPVSGLYTAGDRRNSADLVRVTDSLGNVAEVTVYVWPEWKLGGEGCNCGTGSPGMSPVALLLALLAVRRASRRTRAPRLLAALALGSAAAPALAQEAATAIVVERFEPLGGANDVLSVGSADLPGHLERSAGLSFSFASRPLRLAAPGSLSYAVVSGQATLAAGASVGLFGVAELAVVGSGSVAQSSERAPNVPRGLQPPIAANGFSDVRVVPKVRLGALGPVRAALAVPVTFPTGRTDSFLGEGALTYGPRLLVEAAGGGVRVLGSAGYLIRPDRELLDATIGDAITYGLAAEVPFRLAGKGFAALASVAGEKGRSSAASPLEALLGVRWEGPRGLAVALGAGPGISSGYGTPEWRAFAAFTYRSLPAARQEPAAAPEPPPILVAAIEEPAPPAPLAPPAQARRVPLAVPLPPPPLMQLDARVYFAVNESAIPSRFYGELEKVAATLLANPKPVKVVVEGHADEIGATRHNLALSEARAAKVRAVLQRAGVPADRLRAVGFGDSRPAMPGRHAMNRRVELRVE